MNIITLLFFAVGAGSILFLGLFTVSSFVEKKYRAMWLGILFQIIFTCVWFGGYFVFHPDISVIACAVVLLLLFILLFFASVGSITKQKIGSVTEKVDERDVMFARAEYRPGTEQYDRYYALRPEYKQIDDKIRSMPELLAPGGRYYNTIRSEYTKAMFKLEENLTTYVDGPVNSEKLDVDPANISSILKQKTLHLGANDVGIARLNPYYVYSHVGRGPEQWGAEINNSHSFVLAFTVEMAYEKVREAPDIGITEETAVQYLNAQRISILLAQFIRDIGYSARAHVSGSNYQIMLSLAAYDAGLGEIGRMTYLISPTLGARIRLGAVTTDIPLVPDKPIAFGVQDFCELCKKCAINCPSGAIPYKGKSNVRGVEKWQLNIEKCYQYWRHTGTDCGLCMKVCPFSHPDTVVHNIVRKGIKQSAFARRISLYADNLFYGKKAAFPKFHG